LLLKLASQAPDLPISKDQIKTAQKETNLKVAIAQDPAFGFYYPGDLNAFRAEGVELVKFNTIKDKQLPDVDGLFIGGGFPESWMAEL